MFWSSSPAVWWLLCFLVCLFPFERECELQASFGGNCRMRAEMREPNKQPPSSVQPCFCACVYVCVFENPHYIVALYDGNKIINRVLRTQRTKRLDSTSTSSVRTAHTWENSTYACVWTHHHHLHINSVCMCGWHEKPATARVRQTHRRSRFRQIGWRSQ